MICVFDVTGGPSRGRRFWLRANEQMEIGRISTADFSVPTDPHMSRRHLVLEGDVEVFRVRDVGSANGTFVNEARISSVELCNGDEIRAGVTTFSVSLLDDDENPHAKDGFSFSQAKTIQDSAEAVIPVRTVESDLYNVDDEQTTRHCELPQELRDLVSGKSPARQQSANGWLSEFKFQPSAISGLYIQQTVASDCRLPHVLLRLESDYVVSAMVEFEKLGRFGKQQVSKLIEEQTVSWLTDTVCRIVHNGGHGFRHLAEIAVTQDAMILFASKQEVATDELSQLAERVATPSQLMSSIIDEASGLKRELRIVADLVLFEKDRSGRLCVLTR